jgi:hypothetical protein
MDLLITTACCIMDKCHFFQFSMEKSKDKKKKVVESDSTSDSGPEDVSIWIVHKHFFFWSISRHSDVLMTGQSLQIQADVLCVYASSYASKSSVPLCVLLGI